MLDRVAQHLLVILPVERRQDWLGEEVLGAAPPGEGGDEPGPERDTAAAAQDPLNQSHPEVVDPVQTTEDGALESAEAEQGTVLPAVLLPGGGDGQAGGVAGDAHLLPAGGVEAEPAVHSRAAGEAGEVTTATESGAASGPDLGAGSEGGVEPDLDVQQSGQEHEPVAGRPDDQLPGLERPASAVPPAEHLTDQEAATTPPTINGQGESVAVVTAGNKDTAVHPAQQSVEVPAGNNDDQQRLVPQPRRSKRAKKMNPRFK